MIDLHAHVVLESVLGAAGHLGPELDEGDEADGRPPCFRVGDYTLVGVRYRDSPFMDVDRRLEAMDERGIELQVLSPNPLTYFSHVDTERADAFCRRHNDALAGSWPEHPTGWPGFAQLPMQDPRRAVAELERAVQRPRSPGALPGHRPGPPPRRSRPSTRCGRPASTSTSRCSSTPPPTASTGLGGMNGWPASTATCGWASSTRRRWRCRRSCWAEFSIAIPTSTSASATAAARTSWLAERMEHAARTRPWADDSLAEPGSVAERLGRLWWDAHVGRPQALAALIATFGPERLVAGTNLAGWDESSDPSCGDVALAATIDANARRLLRLDLPTDEPRTDDAAEA